VRWISRWFCNTQSESCENVDYGSVIRDLITLILYHQAQFVPSQTTYGKDSIVRSYLWLILSESILVTEVSSETIHDIIIYPVSSGYMWCVDCTLREFAMVPEVYCSGLWHLGSCCYWMLFSTCSCFIEVCCDIIISSPIYMWETKQSFLLIHEFNALKASSNMNYIETFRSYRAVNTLLPGYANQPVSAVGK
jgi:hypothetical protein